MAGPSISIYCRETIIPVRGIYTACRSCLARALWGKNNGRVTPTTKYFLTGHPLSGPVKDAFAQFLTARQLFGHPVAANPQGEE
jgi:hypothetical protein